MKKIMFNDKYGLTAAVLNGSKTQTRRRGAISQHQYEVSIGKYPNCGEAYKKSMVLTAPYKVGEIVAVAQAYKDIYGSFENCPDEIIIAGYNNKMFVKAKHMPHQIRITRVWVERLQDISDEDCVKEGIFDYVMEDRVLYYYNFSNEQYYTTPRLAYAALIDKISGKGTWESNPFVYCYEFELVK